VTNITDINTTKTRLQRLLQSATPKSNKQPQQNNLFGKTIPTLIVISLLGSMLPFETVTIFFSLSFATITLLALILLWKKQLRITKGKTALISTLIITSLLSGCSPAFTFNTPPELIKFAHEHDFDVYTIRKVGVFGLGLQDATIAAAQAECDIKTIQGAQITEGHGLISIVTVTIAGKS
jgi:hypothetical protein